MVKVISGLGTVRLGMEMMGCISGYGQSSRRPKAETRAGEGEGAFGSAFLTFDTEVIASGTESEMMAQNLLEPHTSVCT